MNDGRDSQRCTLCYEVKPLSEFHRKGGGYIYWCKPCRTVYDSAYYWRTRDLRIAQRRARGVALAAWVRELKKQPCTDCHETFHHAAMTFDHLPGTTKLGEIANMATRTSKAAIRAELAKCELVCANCHAVRTFKRRLEMLEQAA